MTDVAEKNQQVKLLSIITPLYNEEDNVALLYERIVNAVAPIGIDFEILFVDDGSKDNTMSEARKLAEKDIRLRIIKFRRNFGQTPAMAAGIDEARGDVLITMDGDLQNDPDDIPRLLQKLEEGYDIAVGWRHNRQDKLVTRKIPSRIANWLIGKITGVPIKDNGCSLKAYRADVIKNIPLYSEMHRFIPAMSSLAGTRIAEIKVKHHARVFGESKYGLSRIYKVLVDLLTIKAILSFFSRPLL
ncbi:MAG: glycosyltransferase family 2 protein, partial [Gammaproteobacteria bacterium]|nr:glycosyltransferase family 2 protein [Gammaproteobacteria bacterium]